MPPYTIVYSRRAQRDLRRLDPPVARRITAAIERFAAEGIGDVRPLRPSAPTWPPSWTSWPPPARSARGACAASDAHATHTAAA